MSRHDTARILYVEASATCQATLRRLVSLVDPRSELVCAGSMAEARALLAAVPVDMILLDNALPDGRGADFAMEIAADPRLAGTPLALLSDWPSPFMYAKAKAARALGVLSKDEVNVAALRQLLGAARIMPPRPDEGRDGRFASAPVRRRRTAAA